MSSEAVVLKQVWLEMSETSTLFRLNTGKAWISGIGPKGVHRLKDGSIHIEAPRPIAVGFGLVSGAPVVGACDLPGYTEIVVTQAMVGHTIPVFTSIETKRTEGGKVSPDQRNWMEQVVRAGGIAGIANSPDAAAAILSSWRSRFGV